MKFAPQMAFLALLVLNACTPACQSIQIHQWSKAEQEQIAAEHNALPKDDVLRGVLDEWVNLRAQVKMPAGS